MSGIAGVYNLNGDPVDPVVLGRMGHALAHRGPDGDSHWIDGPAGLACQLMRVTPESRAEIQPFVHASGAVIVFDGRLDNRDELIGRIDAARGVPADAPDPVLVMAAYDKFGDRFPEYLNGDFALGLYDPRHARMILTRDAIGVRPLYYCRTPRTFLFASEIKAILTHPQVAIRPNDDMLAAFIMGNRAEHCHGLTCFDGVFTLPPAYMAIVTRDGFVMRQYWDFDPAHTIRYRSPHEYVEAFRGHFERAVGRRLRSAAPVAVSVSGGLDSSAVFCVGETLARRDPARSARVAGITCTYAAGTPADEASFVTAIERHLGVTIDRLPIGALRFFDRYADTVRQLEIPLILSQWDDMSQVLDRARQIGARVILNGLFGDHVLDEQAYLVDLVRHLSWRTVSAHLREYPLGGAGATDATAFRREFWRSILRDSLPEGLLPGLRRVKARILGHTQGADWYTAEFRRRAQHPRGALRVPQPSGTARFRHLYWQVRSRRTALFLEWQNCFAAARGMEVAFPFLDRDLLTFLLAMPGDVAMRNGVPKSILREALHGTLPVEIASRRSKADFTDLVNEAMAFDFATLIGALRADKDLVESGYVRQGRMAALETLKDRIQGPTQQTAWDLCDLYGLAIWLRMCRTVETNRRRE